MNSQFDTLLRRSRRWGLCGTTLCGVGVGLVLLGAGPIQDLKAEPEPMARPAPVTVQLLTAPSTAGAAPQDAPAQIVPASAAPEPENSPSPALAEVTPPAAPQKVAPKDSTPQKDRAPKPQPRKQAVSHTPTAPVAAPRLPASTTSEGTASSGNPSSPSASLTASQQTKASLLAHVMTQFEQHKRYPPAARKLGLEGVVRMQVRVDTQGRIAHIRLLDSNAHAMLGKSGMESMRKVQERWTPQPQKQEIILEIAVRYTLSK